MSEVVLITVTNIQRIPFLNITGPIAKPVAVSRTVADNLKTLGFNVIEHESRDVISPMNTLVEPEEVVTTDLDPTVEDTDPSPLLPQPTELPENLQVLDGTKEVYAEETVEEEQEETSEDEEETAEGEELAVYELSVYKKWKVDKLLKYLETAKEYLSEETYESLPSLTKAELLKVIEEEIIPMAE